MTQEQFVPDIEQVKKVSLQFQEIFQRMDREIGVLDDLIAELDQQIQTTWRSPSHFLNPKNHRNLYHEH